MMNRIPVILGALAVLAFIIYSSVFVVTNSLRLRRFAPVDQAPVG